MANLAITKEDPQSAKQFLLRCLVDQAHRDGVTLSDIEKRLFLFSETDGNTDWDANQHFDAEYNDIEYEAKIAKLLHRSDVQARNSTAEMTAWQSALEAVRDVDFYGLIMVDRARIPRPKPRISVTATSILRGLLSMEDPLFFTAKAGIVILAFFLILDPWRLGILRADIAKLLCIAVAAVAFWVVGRIEKRALLRELENIANSTSK
jgi:hypothetical protein